MNRLRISSRIAALLLVAATTFLASGVALADPPYRVARLGFASGSVSFSPAGEEDWVQANLNRPLVTGDRLWVVPGGRAELQLGAASIRIGSGSAVNLLNIDDRVAQIELTQGTVNVRVRRYIPGQVLEVDTPNLAFSLRRAGLYRITVDPNGDATAVIVRDGQGDVFGDGAAYVVNRGEAYRYYGSGLRDFDRLNRVADDEFDRWSIERERRYTSSVSSRYVSADVIGYEDLDANGAWRPVPGYGNVWFPRRVAAGWAPYRDGHWSWVEPWGWTWVDDAPWGFAVSHYGRWAYVNNGWGWVPGPARERAVYAPALVAFVGGGDFSVSVSAGPAVAWFPLGPREVYRPSYPVSRDYFARVNSSNSVFTNVNVTNYYNNANVPNVTYVNQRVPGAVVAVPRTAFVQSQPVARAAIRVDAQQAMSRPVVQAVAIAPVQRSIVGASAAGARPPREVIDRTVVAKTAPPAPPPAFAAREQALNASPGRPMATADAQKLQPGRRDQAQAPAPRVIAAAPAQPTASMANATPEKAPPGSPRGRPEGAAAAPDAGKGRPGMPVPGAPVAQPSQPAPAPAAGPGSERKGPDDRKGAPDDKKGQPDDKKGAQDDKKGAQDDKKGAQDDKKGAQDDKKGPPEGRGRPDAQPAPQAPPPQAPVVRPQPVPQPTPPPPAAAPMDRKAAPDADKKGQPDDKKGAQDDKKGPPEGRGRPDAQPAPQTPPPQAPIVRPQPAPQPALPPPAAVPSEKKGQADDKKGQREGRGRPDAQPAQVAPTPPPQAAPPQPDRAAPPPPRPQPPQAAPAPPAPQPERAAPPPPRPQPPQATPAPPAPQPERAAPPPPRPQPPQAAPAPPQAAPPPPPRPQPQGAPAPQPQPGAAPPNAERRAPEAKGRPEEKKAKDDDKAKDEDKAKDDDKKGKKPQ